MGKTMDIITNEASGTVFQIQRFSVNDGPGIRTAVFLKGCPLDCAWCHNPESNSPGPELSYAKRLCIGCGQCVIRCPQGCHRMENGIHVLDRKDCLLCGRCAEACVGALEIIGKKMTYGEVMKAVSRDKLFYDNSGGGLTLTGGEPMMQYEFSLSILKAARYAGINTCMETSGYAKTEHILSVAEYTDLLLYDWKFTDDALHRRWTGVSNELILKNISALDASGARLILRCPLVPGLHDNEHLIGIAKTANSMRNIEAIHVMPYHCLGKSKHDALGSSDLMCDTPAAQDSDTAGWISAIQSLTDIPVRRG